MDKRILILDTLAVLGVGWGALLDGIHTLLSILVLSVTLYVTIKKYKNDLHIRKSGISGVNSSGDIGNNHKTDTHK